MSIKNYTWKCERCDRQVNADLPEEGVSRYADGNTAIQDALPDVHPSIREMFKMHWCLTCVNEIYDALKEMEDG